MTRDKLLEYIAEKHKPALKKVGIEPTDTQESMFYILNDAMDGKDAAAQKKIADRKVEGLIRDREAAIKEATPAAAVEEVKETANVSNVGS